MHTAISLPDLTADVIMNGTKDSIERLFADVVAVRDADSNVSRTSF